MSSVGSDSIARHALTVILSWNDTTDILRFGYSALLITHLISSCEATKSFLLKTHLEESDTSGPRDVLQALLRSLTSAIRAQVDLNVPILLMRLLVAWVDEFEPAARAVLQNQAFMQCILEILHQETQNMHVVGMAALFAASCFLAAGSTGSGLTSLTKVEKYIEKLDFVRKSDEFRFAEERKVRPPTLDHKLLSLTRLQFMELADLDTSQGLMYDYDFTVLFKRILDKIQSHSAVPPPGSHASAPESSRHVDSEEHSRIVQSYRDLLAQADARAEVFRVRASELEGQLSKLTRTPSGGPSVEVHLRIENDQLRKAIQERDVELSSREKLMRELETRLNRLPRSDVELLKAQLDGSMKNQVALQEQISVLTNERAAFLESQAERTRSQQNPATALNVDYQRKCVELSTALETLQKDHDELLICLAQIESENAEFRKKLGISYDGTQ
jgi:hypothetical protein